MSSRDQSWEEIKIAREIWPPNPEKILLQYNRAEAIDSKYFQIYKDRARLFYVLNQIKKSNEDYERWRSLDINWENEVDLEIDLRKNFSNKNIYPWEKLKKYFEKNSEVIKKEFERADRKENRVEREEKERKEKERRMRVEQKGRKERKMEKNRNKRERERKRKEEISESRWAHNSIKTSYRGLDLDVDFDSDENIEFMYQNLFNFQIIAVEIRDGIQHTIDTIQKKDGSFKGYFKYLNKVDENEELNFTKLYEFCKIKLETENFYELEFENLINKTDTKFKNYFISNQKYLEKWSDSFCESFMILYQHLHHIPIETKKPINLKKILESQINEKNDDIYENVEIKTNIFEENKKKRKEIPKDIELLKECIKLVENYKKRKTIDDNKIELMDTMIERYNEIKSLKIIANELNLDESYLRETFRILIRVPKKLLNQVNDGSLTFDPILSKEIAFHATDYFNWDGEQEKESQVSEFAKKIAEFFSNQDNLEMKKEFFTTKEDYNTPIRESTKRNNEIKSICEDWPVKESSHPFNFRYDRSAKQYKLLVYIMKNPKVTYFVRRWENENQTRIPKRWASELIDNPDEFLEEHKGEFND